MKARSLNSVSLIFSLTILFFIFGLIGIHFLTDGNLKEKTYWVDHTHKVIEENQKLYITLLNAESGQRGYLLTQKSEYLEPFITARNNSYEALSNLKALTQDNSEQQVRLDRLETLVNEKYDELQLTITLTQASSLDKALDVVNSNQGHSLMEVIRSLIRDINQAEEQLLVRREKELTQIIEGESYLTNVLIGLTILLLIVAHLYLDKFIIKPIAQTTKKFNLLMMLKLPVHKNKS